MDGPGKHARLVGCEVEDYDVHCDPISYNQITCHYALTCLLVRLRSEGHAAYSTMRKAYAEAPML
jgi:hypothetical protein